MKTQGFITSARTGRDAEPQSTGAELLAAFGTGGACVGSVRRERVSAVARG